MLALFSLYSTGIKTNSELSMPESACTLRAVVLSSIVGRSPS